VLPKIKRLRAKSPGVLPSPHRNGAPVKLRCRSRHAHPWKRNRFDHGSFPPY
jgi:hypothetical protein